MKEVLFTFDGGIRESVTAAAYIAVSLDNEQDILFSGARVVGPGTSNTAEYQALIDGLRACLERDIKVVHIIGDSQLIVKQVTGVFKTQKPMLIKHKNIVSKLLEKFDEYTIKWVPREQNHEADRLVNEVFRKVFPKKINQKRERKRLRKSQH